MLQRFFPGYSGVSSSKKAIQAGKATSRSSVLVSVKRYSHKRKSEMLGKRFIKVNIFKANDNVF